MNSHPRDSSSTDNKDIIDLDAMVGYLFSSLIFASSIERPAKLFRNSWHTI